MGALTFTLDPMTPQPNGSRLIVSGRATLSSSYGPDEETYDPSDIGLQQVDTIIFGAATTGDPTTDGYVVVGANIGPFGSNTASPPGRVAVLTTPAGGGALEPVTDTTDLDAYTVPFVAWGY